MEVIKKIHTVELNDDEIEYICMGLEKLPLSSISILLEEFENIRDSTI